MRITSWIAALIVAASVSSAASAAPIALASSVNRETVEPAVTIVPATIGKTPAERFAARATGKPIANVPLVALVRLGDANSPDTFVVKDAHRDGNHVVIAIESRRYHGILHGNVTTMPLVQVELGSLPSGSYTIDVEESVLEFTTPTAPQNASKPTIGLQSSVALDLP